MSLLTIYLKHLYPMSFSSFRRFNTHPQSRHKKIQYSSLLLDHLIQCIDIINGALWIPMITTTIGIYMYNIFTLFGLYRLLMSYSSKFLSTMLSRLLWNTASLVQLLLVTIFGEMVKYQGSELLATIQKLLEDQTSSWTFVDAVSN